MERWDWGKQWVEVHADHLTWFEMEVGVRLASEVACDQSFADFLARGPWAGGVPAEIVVNVTAAVNARLAAGRAS